MKKILTILLLFVAMNASAQHLKFMGIPLDGSIDAFQSKLTNKGMTVIKLANELSIGGRAYKGVFCGYDAEVYVYFDTKTKIVYRGKACIFNEDLNIIKQRYSEIKAMLQEKYDWACVAEDKSEGYDTFEMYVFKEGTTDCSSKDYFGVIQLYISEITTDVYKTTYSLHIDYKDRINKEKNQSSRASDL